MISSSTVLPWPGPVTARLRQWSVHTIPSSPWDRELFEEKDHTVHLCVLSTPHGQTRSERMENGGWMMVWKYSSVCFRWNTWLSSYVSPIESIRLEINTWRKFKKKKKPVHINFLSWQFRKKIPTAQTRVWIHENFIGRAPREYILQRLGLGKCSVP